ncbi:MAG: hypothetical protein ACYTG0_36760, partial [Planctomycetota bacterium]
MNDTRTGALTSTAVPVRIATLATLALLIPAGACRRSSSTSSRPVDPNVSRIRHEELVKIALEDLNAHERHDGADPPEHIVHRLDQWVKDLEPLPDWHVDPLVAGAIAPFSDFADQSGQIGTRIAEVRDHVELIGLARHFASLIVGLERVSAQSPSSHAGGGVPPSNDSESQFQLIVDRLGNVARKMDTIAARRGLDDVRRIAAGIRNVRGRLEPSGSEIAVGDLKRLAAELGSAAGLFDRSKLEGLAAKARSLAPPLGSLAAQMAQFAKKQSATGLIEPAWLLELAAYVQSLGAHAAALGQPALEPQLIELTRRVERLETQLRELTELGKLEFHDSDSLFLREAVWLRDVSSWARGDGINELEQAKKLFDWTVRNVQLLPLASFARAPAEGPALQDPWDTLRFGRGTAMDRAWVFVLLARQQRIDAGLVALVNPKAPPQQGVQPWVVGVLSEGEVYLFEPTLGLPIPAPDGLKRAASGGLDIQPATLSEVAADDALLRRLDLDPKRRYPVDSSHVQSVDVLMEASPANLSQRMKRLEALTAGDKQIVLTTDASAQAERFKACRHVGGARIWGLPYLTLTQKLWWDSDRDQWQESHSGPFDCRDKVLSRGRQYHIKGVFIGEESATMHYQSARPSNKDMWSDEVEPKLRPSLRGAKMNASYWLGLVAYERGDWESAIDWLDTRTLQVSWESAFDWLDPRTRQVPWDGTRTLEDAYRDAWIGGAYYNLARAYEADGQIAKAIQTYRSDTATPY